MARLSVTGLSVAQEVFKPCKKLGEFSVSHATTYVKYRVIGEVRVQMLATYFKQRQVVYWFTFG